MPSLQITALVAHQDEALRGQLVSLLSDLGWTVWQAHDGPSTIEAYRDQGPQIVLVDEGVSDDGGAAVCRTLRLLPGSRFTAVVATRSAGSEGSIAPFLEAGADDVLEYPCQGELLVHRLERALRDPARSTEGELSEDEPAGDWLDALAGDVEEIEDHHLAVLCVHVSLTARPGGTEPDEGILMTLAGLAPNRIEKAIAAFERSHPTLGVPGSIRVRSQGPCRFLLIAPRLERIQDAAKLASALQDELSISYGIDGEEFLGIANLGIASSPTDGRDASELVRRAETACYCSRQEGGSNSQYYAESMSRWAFERLTLERSLREAVDRDEMEVYYQPRVAISDRRVVGFEALVRWNHPQLGLVSPGQFIPLAEETGLIVPIGEWVLRTACQQAFDWQQRGFEPVRVSVNLSAAQFRQERLDKVVEGILEETGLAPEWLELEVTESMLMTDAELTVRTLQDLKSMGVHLSIDDFGTGYSSLSYLKRFPIDALKIDRSFVRDVTTNPDDAAIATSIILMGHSLRLSVVAEGVEEERQLSFLQVLQCNEAQGFLFSPPVPAARAEAFLRKRAAA